MHYLKRKKILELLENRLISVEEGFRLIDTIRRMDENILYFDPVWEQSDIQPAAGADAGVVLVFDSGPEIRDALAARLAAPGREHPAIVLVQAGTRYESDGAGSYTIDPRNPSDYQRLVADLKAQGPLPTRILHLWSRSDASEPAGRLEQGIYSVLHLSQALMREKPRERVRLVYTYFGGNGEAQPRHAAVGGFARTIRLEHPKFLYKTLCLPAGADSTRTAESILLEFSQEADAGIEVRYDAEWTRWEKRMRELPAGNDGAGARIREHGVYLLTGGAGGVGLHIAEYLARNYKAKLVLTGRTELGEEKAKKVRELEALGSEVLYVRADVSLREDAERLVALSKARFGPLHGVIHSAGVIRDAFIINKTREEFDAVLAPKVYGTIAMDEATRGEALDFFVLFSSITSVTGNAGQCDYAYGNRFMDSYAEFREELRRSGQRSGKSLSINWPLWQDGGMRVDEKIQRSIENATGVKALGTGKALHAFEKGLSLAASSFLVVDGDRGKVLRTLGIGEKKTTAAESAPSPKADAGALHEKILRDAVKLVCDITKVRESEIDAESELSEYGFDSIGFTDLADRVNNRYRLSLTPAVFFEHPTIASFARHLQDEYPERMIACYAEQGEAIAAVAAEEPAPLAETRRRPRFETGSARGMRQQAHEPIAIIGISGVMPQSDDLDEFWKHLEEGKDLITEIPSDRWDWRRYYGDPSKEPNKTNVKWGGFMREVDKFDSMFFGISPREASLMDPQQRIFLESVWKAVEDAGYRASDLSGSKTGLYVGVATSDYSRLLRDHGVEVDAYTSTGMSHSILANRISYLLNLRGPSEPIDTACSSALVAVHRGVEAIREGSCELAIAGGVNVLLDPEVFISFNKAGMLSEDGRCKTFDKSANGYVRGEGAGALVLKSLRQAESDGDHIYAVIRGTAENHGGRANSLTAPNPNAQTELLIEAYEQAGIEPDTVSYIEAHGTGTSLGDPIEINGLKNAFQELYKRSGKTFSGKKHCGLGSVKSNAGHLETAAGVAGLFKVLLSMRHGRLPASLHVREVNPYIRLEDSPFYIVRQSVAWERQHDEFGQPVPRRAGVSSFGFGGVNAHVVLEEYLPGEQRAEAEDNSPRVIVVSAKNEERLRSYALNMAHHLRKNAETLSFADLAYTLQVGREAMEERLAVIASSIDEVVEKLTAYCEGRDGIEHLYRGNAKKTEARSESMIEGKEGEQFVRTVLEEGKLVKLAKLWASGVSVDWKLLYRDRVCNRLSLPTYPFLRERCWMPNAGEVRALSRNGRGRFSGLHPLIDGNISTLREQKFSARLSGHEFYLSDHMVKNRKILPGVVFLEMARAAGEFAGEAPISKIVNVSWTRPLIVSDTAQDVQVSLYPSSRGADYEVSTGNGNGRRAVHARGRLVYENRAAGPAVAEEQAPAEAIDIAAVRGRCTSPMSRAECYERFLAMGLQYGPSFQVIRELVHNEHEALASLVIPDARMGDLREFRLHPSLLDGALQTVTGLLKTDGLYLPFSTGEIEINGLLPGTCYAYATHAGGASSSVKMFTVYLLDETGRVLVKMKDFCVKAVMQSSEAVNQPLPKRERAAAGQTAAPSGDFLKAIKKDLLLMVQDTVKVRESEIDAESELSEYGFDSIGFTDLADRVNSRYRLSLTPAVFFEHPTIASFARHLQDEYPERMIACYAEQGEAIAAVAAEEPAPLAETRRRPRFETGSARGMRQQAHEPIAIIGISGVMPQSDDLDEFWKHLEEGKDLITEIPSDRWDWRRYYGDPSKEPNKTNVKWGGFMREVDKFDSMFFGISPREASLMDPQQRIFLESVWKAVEDAGYRASDLSGSKTGLYVGVATSDYSRLLRDHGVEVDAYTSTGMSHSILANRISYLLNLRGPSEPIDTACSSALVAVHRGVEAIREGSCELAIAGGVNVLLDPEVFISFNKAGMLSEDGRCKTFDKSANGYVRGEGAGALVLKSLRQAEADGDHIYAVIRGTAENHGGRANSLTAPNPNAQTELLIEAYEQAGIEPDTVSYIEAHGTGTSLGDPIEINGLKNAFQELYKRSGKTFSGKKHCGLGSVKSNAGHLETAAGVAGLFKVLLSMRHGRLPASLHVREVNPYIRLDDSPFYIVRQSVAWERQHDEFGQPVPRRAGVSSFGFGGVNAHVVLEEYLPGEPRVEADDNSPRVIVVSAKNEERLRSYAEKLVSHLQERSAPGDGAAAGSGVVSRLRQDLKRYAGEIINVSPEEIDEDEELAGAGFDLLALTSLAAAISEAYGAQIKASVFSDHPTIAALSGYLTRTCHEALRARYGQEHEGQEQRKAPATLSLAAVAFTLQTGREAMEERLAIVVSSMDELVQKLSDYCRGKAGIEHLYRGNTKKKHSPSELSILMEGQEGREFLKTVLDGKKAHKLAMVWASGVDLDWKALYGDRPPRRVPLPGYPFERKRFWLLDGGNGKPGRACATALHTMIDSNDSTLEEQVYSKSLSIDDFYIHDHVVGDKHLLPGVAYLEMARAAGALAHKRGRVAKIKNTTWAYPVEVGPAGRKISIGLLPADKGTVTFRISSADSDTGSITHAQGTLEYGSNGAVSPERKILDIPRLLSSMKAGSSNASLYDHFRSLGFNYGNRLQAIQEVYAGEREMLSRVVLPPGLESANDMELHPSIMDGALQTVICFNRETENDTLYLPYSLGEVEIMERPRDACYVHVRAKESTGETKSYDLTITDAEGTIAVELRDFRVKAVRQAAVKTDKAGDAGREQSTLLYCAPAWKSEPAVPEQRKGRGAIVLFDGNENLFRELASRPGGAILVKPSSRYKEVSERVYTIRPDREKDYESLAKSLLEKNAGETRIVHAWNCSAAGADLSGSRSLAASLDTGLHSVFHLTKALMKLNTREQIRLLYFQVESSESIQPQNAAVAGLVKTVGRENPRFDYRHVRLDALPATPALADIIETEFSGGSGNEVKYENNERKARTMTVLESAKQKTLRLKKGGVYLITGGMGGLGLVFARHLARNYRANLILTGRSACGADQRRTLKELESTGGRALYLKADVLKPADLGNVIRRIKKQFKTLNGVVHAAGLIEDSLIINKDVASFRRVLAPKIQGTVNLDEATKAEKTDFFVVFSSLASVLGNTGQGDYAAGNSFLDAFVRQRRQLVDRKKRHGLSLSLNWPLWRDGGMKIGPANEERLSKATGMNLLESDRGVQAFETALGFGLPQVAIAEGVRTKLEQTLGIAAEKTEVVPPAAPGRGRRSPEESFRKTLLRLASEVLKVPDSDIDPETSLVDYGLDSIATMQLSGKLEKVLNRTIEPSVFLDYQNIDSLARFFAETETVQETSAGDDGSADRGASQDSAREIRDRFVRGDGNRAEAPGNSSREIPDAGPVTPPGQEIVERKEYAAKSIFLTGATGVLGGYVLRQLLLTTPSKMYCLVRDENDKKALERIKRILQVYGKNRKVVEELERRVTPVLGDITREKFGLSSSAYGELAGRTDVVIHSAASTNLYLPYKHLEPVNVGGVKNIIAFALETRQKYALYVSSYSVMGDLIYKSNTAFTEKHFNVGQQFPRLGYQQSKFEGERLIREASGKGLMWDIVRPGNIFGDSSTGMYPFGLTGVTELYYELFELVIKNRLAVFGRNYFDITPVDYVAKAIVHIVGSRPTFRETYHLVNPNRKRWYEIVNLLIEFGYPIKFIETDEYMDMVDRDLLQYRKNKEEQVLLNILKYNFDRALFNNDSYPDAAYTEKVLAPAGIVCPEISLNLIGNYLGKYASTKKISLPGKGGAGKS